MQVEARVVEKVKLSLARPKFGTEGTLEMEMQLERAPPALLTIHDVDNEIAVTGFSLSNIQFPADLFGEGPSGQNGERPRSVPTEAPALGLDAAAVAGTGRPVTSPSKSRHADSDDPHLIMGSTVPEPDVEIRFSHLLCGTP